MPVKLVIYLKKKFNNFLIDHCVINFRINVNYIILIILTCFNLFVDESRNFIV